VSDPDDLLPHPADPIYPAEPQRPKAALSVEKDIDSANADIDSVDQRIAAIDKPDQLISPIECCKPRLLAEIAAAKSIVIVGKEASRELAGIKKSIMDEYGFPRQVEGKPAVVTMHPAVIPGKMAKYHGAFNIWVSRAARMAKDGLPKWKNHQPYYTPYKVNILLKDLLSNADKSNGHISVSVDVETSGLDPVCDELRCVALTYGNTSLVIPFKSVETAKTLIDKTSLALLRKVLLHSNIRKVFHNGIFDQAVLESQVGPVAWPVGDTLMAHHAIESEVPHSLSFISSILLDGPSWKSLGEGSHGLTVQNDKTLWLYNAIDTHRTSECDKLLKEIVDADGLSEVHKVDLEIQNILARMFARGLLLSQKNRMLIQSRLETNGIRCYQECIDTLRKTGAYQSERFLSALEGKDFTPSVPKHKIAAVTHLGMDKFLPATEKTGTLSTKGDDLGRALPSCSDEARLFVGKKLDSTSDGSGLLGYMASQKAIATFCQTPTAQDGRVRSSWRQHGTPTGRMSSSKPNLQNIPEWMRAMYVPPPGYVYVGADYTALELWVNAIYSQSSNLLKALASQDVHRSNAEGLFNFSFYESAMEAALKGCPEHGTLSRSKVTLEDRGKVIIPTWHNTSCQACLDVARVSFDKRLTKLLDLRKQAKTYVYAKNYRASDTTIWMRCLLEFPDMQLSEVVAMGSQWDKVNPELGRKADENYQLYIKRRLKNGMGYLETPILGRRRYWTGKQFSPTDAANYPIQGGAADIVNLAAIRVDPLMRNINAHLCAQVHDAFLYEVPVRYADVAKDILNNELPGKYKFRDIDGLWSFPVVAKIGTSWNEV
jgi:DNA polymerase-1